MSDKQRIMHGGFTVQEGIELQEEIVKCHISKAISSEKMKKADRDADLQWIHGVLVRTSWFVKTSIEQNELMHQALQKVLDTFDHYPDRLVTVQTKQQVLQNIRELLERVEHG
ncbi:hypothetical protein NW995_002475 [Salmonella enterica]|nr:hypothetical protein [Salmonella enterica]